ncbi:MAG TPA: N-acetylglucosamine-specific PTS transporter subunit IIBC [Usitatibacter sp.]|nr:N-acetylglucosamine-specific PTS transporter subunit IIBC [Usitatibacter sp.]
MRSLVDLTQRLGRALMLPIAVLPVAGLLLRLGQPDLLDIPAMAEAGGAIFYYLGMLFAVGIAVGLARENHGAAGVAGLVAYVVAWKGSELLLAVPPDVVAGIVDKKLEALASDGYRRAQIHTISVPMGILAGIVAGALYNRYYQIKLPDYLAFFAGRRFVPILAGVAGLVLAFAFGLGYPAVAKGMNVLSQAVVQSGSVGLFVYGVLNRVLIVTGLHHILNNLAWFILGDYQGATGDLNRFFKGDPTAGVFMSGFFPVMMFGLPAACLAMYRCALPERKRATGGLLFSMALTSFLTGVTEPIEFAFMFLAPALYVLHAILTGAAMVIMAAIGCHLGFGFSAGLFDYALNFAKATHPLYLIPVGAIYFAVYYFAFRWAIVRFNLATPGRAPEEAIAVAAPAGDASRADGFIEALGGAANLVEVEACTTRLRLVLADRTKVDARRLSALGSRGTIDVGASGMQVVVGPIADQVASEIRAQLPASRLQPPAPPLHSTSSLPPPASLSSSLPDARAIVDALGGAGNVASVDVVAGRVLITVRERDRVNVKPLRALLERGAAVTSKSSVHLLHGDSQGLASHLRAALG